MLKNEILKNFPCLAIEINNEDKGKFLDALVAVMQ